MKVTDFLQGRDVERQAVTRYINRHEEIFKGHVGKVGKELDLDAVAVEELEKVYPYPKPVTIVQGVPHEEFIELQNELIESQQRMNDLQERLLNTQEQLATARATELLLEDKLKRIEELEKRTDDQMQEIKELRDALSTEKAKTWFQKLLKK